MSWVLIFMISLGGTPVKQTFVGYFPNQETCMKERAYLNDNAHYRKMWACVQLPSEAVKNLNHPTKD